MIPLALAGCESTAFLPRGGPESLSLTTRATVTVGSREEAGALPYVLVNIDPTIVKALPRGSTGSFGSLAQQRRGGEIRPGIGDVIAVTIYESGAGGLFSSIEANGTTRGGGSNQTSLPNQAVDRAGQITVPYAGQISVAGRTINDIQTTIIDRLKNRAIEPQVIVSVQEQRASQASVLGDVNSAGVYAIAQGGSRILDAIARAGGPKSQPYETTVYLQRNQTRAGISFSRLLSTPSENVYVAPGDTIVLAREPKSYIVVGAATTNARVDFDRPSITLADAVGKSAGLVDERSDAGSIFVYRFETRSVVSRLGVDTSGFEAGSVPVLYRANLSSPQGYFLAKEFEIRDGDVIFIANAFSTEFKKFFEVLRGPTSLTRDIFTIRQLLASSAGSGGVSIVP